MERLIDDLSPDEIARVQAAVDQIHNEMAFMSMFGEDDEEAVQYMMDTMTLEQFFQVSNLPLDQLRAYVDEIKRQMADESR